MSMDERESQGFQEEAGESPYVYNPAAKAAYQAAGAAVPQTEPKPQPQEVPKKPEGKGRRNIIIAAIIVAVLLCCFGVGSCVTSAFESVASPLGSRSADITQDSVAVIEISGEIAYDNSACSPEGFKELLDRAEANKHVKAVVLRVNSGGGVATAGEEMTEYLKNFSKPVVVSSAAMNASAAYEISSQADYIFTARSSAIGAIGTAMQLVDYSGLMSLLGIKVDNVTSAESKDSSYGTRPLTDDERSYYQQQVDQINQVFIDNVAEGRNMDPQAVRKLATGLTFTGVDAVANGLADEIGTLEDACKKAAQLAGMRQYDIAYLDLANALSLGSLLSMETNVNITSQDFASAIKELK